MIRARWAELYQGSPRELHTAYSWESIVDETCFIFGPILSIGLSTAWFPEAGPLLAAGFLAVGVFWLTAQRATEPVPHPREQHAKGSGAALAGAAGAGGDVRGDRRDLRGDRRGDRGLRRGGRAQGGGQPGAGGLRARLLPGRCGLRAAAPEGPSVRPLAGGGVRDGGEHGAAATGGLAAAAGRRAVRRRAVHRPDDGDHDGAGRGACAAGEADRGHDLDQHRPGGGRRAGSVGGRLGGGRRRGRPGLSGAGGGRGARRAGGVRGLPLSAGTARAGRIRPGERRRGQHGPTAAHGRRRHVA